MVCPSNFLYSILKINTKMIMFITLPLFVPSLGRRVQQKNTVPFSLLRVLGRRDTEQKRCVFGLTKEPDQLHARSSDVIIRSSTNKFLSIWRGCVTDQTLSPIPWTHANHSQLIKTIDICRVTQLYLVIKFLV